MHISKEILNRYNQPGPRYTSYPPANHFTDDFTSTDYLKAVEISNGNDPQHLSFYVHIPFCRRMCFFCGCNSIRYPSHTLVDLYIDAVVKEIHTVAKAIDKSRKVAQIHWGGGTPNAISLEQIGKIMSAFDELFTYHENIEVAIECHPALLDAAYVEGLKKIGFNRFSLGVQDFDRQVLAAINREPSTLPLEELVPMISENGKYGVNLDFIYGLPYQNLEQFKATMQKAADLSPDRLVTFSYAHVPWVNKAMKKLETYGLPSADEKFSMLTESHQLLLDAGYEAIGMDHYAKKDDELYTALQEKKLHRNFQGYATRETTGQVYAFGTTGISQLWDTYAQNEKHTQTYIDKITANGTAIVKGYKLSNNEILIREVINEVMCNLRLNWEIMADRLNTDVKTLKDLTRFTPEKLQQFETDQLLSMDGQHNLDIHKLGTFFIRNIAMVFDPLLETSQTTYSKTI
ncbi:oxygen-independent coproporphyrinogen III oxidase [Prolixibacteraceae bacterium JC049]|nr:oxygen-independent coproporphyrinogen III oxidase [Prolixibacteraceae bacterium JC049]